MSQRAVEAILDTSALYPLLKRLGVASASLLSRLTILDLTKYELGNALCREHKLGLLKSWEDTMESWSQVMEGLQVCSVDVQSLKNVEKIAIERDMTFYDAAYVYVAETRDLKLVTEDDDLLDKCKKSVSLDGFLKTGGFKPTREASGGVGSR
jgi:predicted nucleic acid-binding protein